MAYELKDGQGTLFRNDKQNDKQPDYRGECKIDGKLLDIAGWLKQGKKVKYMFLVIKPPQQAPVADRPQEDPEDIPF